MTKAISRRDFLKYSIGGVAVVAIGSRLAWLGADKTFAATQTLNIRITDAMKQMGTFNTGTNPGALCYFWVYELTDPTFTNPIVAPECPGPTIICTKGDTVNIAIKNDLDEPHAFFVKGVGLAGADVTTGSILPGATGNLSFVASVSGAHLYHDNLNAPVNRVMGLHGALIVMPSAPALARKFTPYDATAVSPAVQKLYDDFGTAVWPGLAWEEGDARTWALYDPAIDGPTPVPNCPPFRQYVWLLHQPSPVLFQAVGSLPAGQEMPAAEFLSRFQNNNATGDVNGPFDYTNTASTLPQYFTINGQHGHFCHNNPTVTPMGRVGEPAVVHILNAGLMTHSMHLHANHFFVTAVNGVVQPNPIWVDVFEVESMDRVDYTIPFMRPPDLPNVRGIGFPDTPLTTVANPLIAGSAPHPCWPPVEEFEFHFPAIGAQSVTSGATGLPVDLAQRLSPMCYPMHDHSEPSQTSQGGNYNTGLISGMYLTGDRNKEAEGFLDFPMDEDFHMMFRNIRGARGTALPNAVPNGAEPAAPAP